VGLLTNRGIQQSDCLYRLFKLDGSSIDYAALIGQSDPRAAEGLDA